MRRTRRFSDSQRTATPTVKPFLRILVFGLLYVNNSRFVKFVRHTSNLINV